MWLDRAPIPGSVEAVERLRRAGRRVVFATNFSHARTGELVAALVGIGVSDPAVVTSAHAAASLVEPGERVMVIGGPGIHEALIERGAEIVEGDRAEVVVAGLAPGVDESTIERAARAVRHGARFVATNTDATYPTPSGPVPGAGAVVGAIAAASGSSPLVAGKPHRPMAELVLEVAALSSGSEAIMVGDRVETDGAFAETIGARFALVGSGVSGAEAARPGDLWAVDLASLVDEVLIDEESVGEAAADEWAVRNGARVSDARPGDRPTGPDGRRDRSRSRPGP